MLKKFSMLLAGSIAAVAVSAGAAGASPIIGSDSFSSSVVATSPKTDLFDAKSISLKSNMWGGGQTGNFVLIPNGTTINDTTFNVLSPVGFTFTSADGDFTVDSVVSSSESGSATTGSEILSYILDGTFTTAGTTHSLADNVAQLTMSFTETGIELKNGKIKNLGSFSWSGTIATPGSGSNGSVPEPATLVLLGSGLAGLGALRRRKKQKA